ncbi:MAG: universal stress protein [Pseudomonadota bacterium]|nr:universal stress protein [Pseudomonadota bacterium]
MKILLAVDGSAYTRKMLAYVTTHAELFSPSHAYTVLTVQPALPPQVYAAVGEDIAQGYYAQEAGNILAPVTTLLAQHGIEAPGCCQRGPVGQSIADFAEAGGFDLLVMGSHGHSALASLVMGSVTTQVLAHSRIPVLLIR